MTKTLKWLGGGIAAAMLLTFAGFFSGSQAQAQGQPDFPPAVFQGGVSLDGEGAAAGSAVTAMVGGATCGAGATVTTGEGGSEYRIQVPNSCADAGDEVSFSVNGVRANETGTWDNTQANNLDLTANTPVEESWRTCPSWRIRRRRRHGRRRTCLLPPSRRKTRLSRPMRVRTRRRHGRRRHACCPARGG